MKHPFSCPQTSETVRHSTTGMVAQGDASPVKGVHLHQRVRDSVKMITTTDIDEDNGNGDQGRQEEDDMTDTATSLQRHLGTQNRNSPSQFHRKESISRAPGNSVFSAPL